MKNYKYFFVIIVFFLFVSLIGCNNDLKDDTFIIDVANNEAKATLEIDLWNQKYFMNQTVSQKKDFKYNNITYNLVYDTSVNRKWNSFVTNLYNDNEGIEVGFKDNTDQMVLLNLMNKNFYETEPFKEDVPNSDQYALQLAKEIAKDYININEYELIIGEPKLRDKVKDNQIYYITYYGFTFFRKINDIHTSDYLTIGITSKGNLASILIGDLGAFNNKELPNFSITDINTKVHGKVEKIYKKLGYEVLDKKISYQRLAVTPEGKIGIYTVVHVDLRTNKDNNFRSAIALFTYIE